MKESTKVKVASKVYVIAEIGLNHNGSVDIAKKLIDVACVAGVDAVKFQKRTVDILAVKETLDARDDRFPEFGSTYREIREHLEFNLQEYIVLKNYTESKGLDFMVTAFDAEAVDFLLDLGVSSFKLASHSLTNIELLKYIASKNKSIILSTGMSDFEEIDAAVNILKESTSSVSIMHCVSSYPTPINECNLRMIEVLKNRYGLTTGYSGHEMGYLPSVIAVSLGAEIIERHITLTKSMVGFDHKISLEPHELIAMVKDIRDISLAIGEGNKSVSHNEMVTRRKYHVSMVSNRKIKQGELLTEDMVTYRNPGTGIPYKLAHTILNKTAKCDIANDIILSTEMFN